MEVTERDVNWEVPVVLASLQNRDTVPGLCEPAGEDAASAPRADDDKVNLVSSFRRRVIVPTRCCSCPRRRNRRRRSQPA